MESLPFLSQQKGQWLDEYCKQGTGSFQLTSALCVTGMKNAGEKLFFPGPVPAVGYAVHAIISPWFPSY